MTDTEQKEYAPNSITQLTLTDSCDAACASLCFTYKSSEPIGEIVTVKAYKNGRILFNGYCDCQKMTEEDSGCEIFIYARSSACLLVDDQAKPFTFNCPTARQLWAQFARDKGFEYALGEIGCDKKYEVTSGSCFKAIHDFVSALTGDQIYITADNKISRRQISGDIQSLNKYKILSVCSVINRSEPISVISYKREQDTDYRAHIISKLARERKISSGSFINLSALPQWQRENMIYKRLKESFDDYQTLQLTVSGIVKEALYTRFSYKGGRFSCNDLILTEKKYTADESGERTRLTLKKNMDPGEMIYVD